MTAPAVVDLPTDLGAAESAMFAEIAATTPVETSTEGPPRDEQGRFIAASGATTEIPPGQLPDVTPAEVPAGDENAPAIPEGYVATPVLPEDKARGFTVSDAEGEILPPDLTWKITANGKELTLSTDKLVSYASMGKYNHDLQVGAQQAEQRAQQVEQAHRQALATMQERDNQIEALLSDPDYLYRAQQAFAQHNTPEARAERQRQEIAQQQEQLHLERATMQAHDFIDRTATPALDMILQAYPTLTQDEVAAKFFLAAEPYRRNGVLMPEGFTALKQWIVRDLEPYARQKHEHLMSERSQTTKAADDAKAEAAKKVQAAQVAAQKARGQASRGTRTAGRHQAEAVQEPKITSLKDADAFVISKTLADARGG